MSFGNTSLPWIAPSPNMPSVESALHYPGTCLFEGTNLSVGRGTDVAFQVIGAPWLNGDSVVAALAEYELPGVEIRSFSFTPENPGDGKYRDQTILGIRLTATGSDYDPTLTALALLRETRRISGDRWEWREGHFDRLAGNDRLRAGLEAGQPLESLRAGWDDALEAFRQMREPYLIY
jgi:uncharacterized protein YbbC (DUF1343 family)